MALRPLGLLSGKDRSDGAGIDIDGAFDLHVHTAPDVYPRSVDDDELLADAAAAGMRGILLKSHHTLTADRAALAVKAAGERNGVRVLGGLVLNRSVGGLNPVAVETAVEFGARQIWLPTLHAEHCMRFADLEFVRAEVRRGREPVVVVGGDGRPTPETLAVLEVVRDADAVLGTGHLSPAESLIVLRAARDMGLRRLLVTHALMSFTRFEPSQLRAAVELGAKLELCALSCSPRWHDPVPPAASAAAIRAVGPEHVVLASDGGQVWNARPPAMLRDFARSLQAEGIEEKALRRMLSDNPVELVGLEEA